MNELSAWAAKVRETVAQAERISNAIDDVGTVPSGGTPEERLAALSELWASLGISRPNYPAIEDRASNLAANLKAETDPARYALRRLLHRVHEEMTRLIDGGVECPKHRVLRRSDFGHEGCLVLGGEPAALFGYVDCLPAGHWGRALLAADDQVQIGKRGCLLLGAREQRYYEAETVKRLTLTRRQGQRNEEDDRRRKEENDRREREAARERDPLYRVTKIEEELAATKRRLAEVEGQQAAGKGEPVKRG
jgi:hypothetical protein